ncbi:MAG: hypothetical protein K2Q18_08285, partial [Bdellovibrionales bacterium]|nr:hypothetical protein [Bdellovibrionales bacterium]
TALLLTKEEIVARGEALGNMVEDLFTYSLADWEKNPLSTKPSQKHLGKVNHFCIVDSFALDWIHDALTLEASQINHRIKALQENKDYLLPRKLDDRLSAVHSLLKLEAEEIVTRGEAMKKYQVGQYNVSHFSQPPEINGKNKTLLAASRLNTADLTARLEALDTLIGDPKYKLNVYKPGVEKAAFKLDLNEFTSRLRIINQYRDILSVALDADYHLLAIEKAFTLSPNLSYARLAAIKQYRELFFPNEKPDQHKDMTRLLSSTLEEIYSEARILHYRNHFINNFLPKLEEKFQKHNNSIFTGHELAQLLFPTYASSTFDFSPEEIEPRLSRFGEIYREMFNPPSLEKPHVAIGSSIPSSSPSVAGSSSSNQQDIPATRLIVSGPLKKD